MLYISDYMLILYHSTCIVYMYVPSVLDIIEVFPNTCNFHISINTQNPQALWMTYKPSPDIVL